MKPGWALKVGMTPCERDLLKFIEFWWPKATPRFDDHQWLVKSIAELRDEAVGQWSDRTVRSTISSLRERGILITIRRLHPYVHKSGPVLWIRPNTAEICRMVAGRLPNGCRKVAETTIQTTVQQLDSETSLEQDASHHAGTEPGGPGMSKGADFLEKRKGKSITSGLAVFDPEAKSPTDYPQVTSATIAYNALRAACTASGYPPPGTLTGQASGQLKTLLSRLEQEGLPANRVSKFFFDLVSKWPEFIGWMKTSYDVNIPIRPSVGVLLTKVVEAVAFVATYSGQQASSDPAAVVQPKKSNLDDDF